MLIVGLTGGIGSGKTTVCHLFTELGVEIIDTDKIAHALTQPGQPAFNKILQHFGKNILTDHGELDRSKLADIVFSSSKERLQLETILHPLIREEVISQLSRVETSYCIVVVPLLIESSGYDFLNRILVIDTPESLQIERAMQRDNRTYQQVQNIIASQVDRDTRLQAADDVIENDASLEKLQKQVIDLHQKYLEIAKTVK